MSKFNFQTQHLKGTPKHMADSYYNNIKEQNEEKDFSLKEPVIKKEETIEIEDTYESIMNKVIEKSGLTLDEFMKQNNNIRKALFNNKGLTEEEIAYIEKRLAEEKTK